MPIGRRFLRCAIMNFLLELEFEGLPPTVNHMYRGAKGWRYLTAETIEFQTRISALMRDECQIKEAFTGAVAVFITFYTNNKRRWDIDNRVKALLDCLEKAGIIQDDSQIDALLIKREHGKKTATKIILCEKKLAQEIANSWIN